MKTEKSPFWLRFARFLGYPDTSDLPEIYQKGMKGLWLDTVYAFLSAYFVDRYITLYLLSMGATDAQIGQRASLMQLGQALIVIPAAIIAERTRRYKLQVLIGGGGMSRLLLIPLAIVPLFVVGPDAVPILIALTVGRTMAGMFSNPAWTSLGADIVPMKVRGRFFGARRVLMIVTNVAVTAVAGLIIEAFGGDNPAGYQINIVIAFFIGLIATYWYSTIPEPRRSPESHQKDAEAHHLAQEHSDDNGFSQRDFFIFLGIHSLLMIAVQIAAPFFQPYMKNDLGMSAFLITIVSTWSMLLRLFPERFYASRMELWGIKETMVLGFAATLIPFGWYFVKEPWQVFVVQFLGAMSWPAYQLGQFNLLLSNTPDDKRPRYVAIFTTVSMLVSALGPQIDTFLVETNGFEAALLLSGILRPIAFILFILFVRGPEQKGE
jgi:hypothetical protein